MHDQSDGRSGERPSECRSTMMVDHALETLRESLEQFRMSIGLQEQAIRCLRRMNVRGIRTGTKREIVESAVDHLIVGHLLQRTVAPKMDRGADGETRPERLKPHDPRVPQG